MKALCIWLGMVGLCYGFIACGSGCSPSGLTRSEAERLIRSDAQIIIDIFTLPLKDRTGAEGVRAGLWTIQSELNGQFVADLTRKGLKYFEGVNEEFVSLRRGWKKKVTQVTGIAEAGEGSKEVEFLWEVENAPKEVAGLLNLGPWRARALLRRFDDGWRVRGMDLNGRGFAERQ